MSREIDRRTLLKGAGVLGVSALAGGGIWKVLDWAVKSDAQVAESKVNGLRDKIKAMQDAIETQGTGHAIAKLTDTQDYLCSLGESMYRTGDVKGYWAVFSESLKSAGPEYDHHTPKFWEEIIKLTDGPNLPFGNSLTELVNRVNQHAAHFGKMGDAKKREESIARLKVLHGYASPFVFNSEEAGLRVKFERYQLEKDIGLFYLMAKELSGARRQELAEKTGKLISAWVNGARIPLEKVDPCFNIDLVKQSNPFV